MAKTDIARIEADLAERAKSISKQIGSPDSKRITVDQKDGTLLGPGGVSLGDEMRVIVVDFCTVNRYYDRNYDAANPQPPACYAIGDIILDMAPEPESPAVQSDLCRTCWANEWNSDPGGGRGKACKNSRDLVIVNADELEDPEAEPEMFIVSCSPTSIKSFDAAAAMILRLFNGTPIKAVMTMKVKATANYYNLQFGDIEANPYLERVYPLLADTADLLNKLPDFSTYEEPRVLPAGDVRNQNRPPAPARGRR